ncbi:lysophosphatidic acid receptor 2b isoform X3 [Austrofundulus limnaeus]|uniref:Lysophosphatidic acid receptor 2b isoform X3 n=1 Tax=Austrofundulus limnaeus TaxID=52670 RepID=A0A2I4BU85_AUSLI|nr:PREDICTED: lysophosphatidic acid receptor 1-A-like isoform X3 [Austrofundulus limnaeus]
MESTCSPSKYQHNVTCYDNCSIRFFYEQVNKTISFNWRTRDYLVVTLGLTVSFIVIFSNVLVITSILKNRRFHFPIYYLLGNLALADFFAGISYLHLMFHTGPWTEKLSIDQWYVRQGLIDTSLTASVLNLLAVAVERHQTIFSMQLHSEMSTRRVFIIIVLIWLVALIMGLVPKMGWNCLCDLGSCSSMAPLYSRSYLVFWAVLNLLTFSIMVAIYTRIFFYVRRKSRQMSQHTNQLKHKETVMNLMKTVSMILDLQASYRPEERGHQRGPSHPSRHKRQPSSSSRLNRRQTTKVQHERTFDLKEDASKELLFDAAVSSSISGR